MRQAILASAAAVLACACTTTAPKPQAGLSPISDNPYRNLSCSEIALEVSRTQRSLAGARQRQVGASQAASDLFVPISLTPAPVAQTGRLDKRLRDLQQVSRAKRCTSIALRSATA